ncbi:MAG: VanZ family protein [Planctomycetes bacterium]|nr:VanZ family protein [Planctomycetota bacterium]MCB9904465.1 VanZ family protein [Planctomycetota bacterium]
MSPGTDRAVAVLRAIGTTLTRLPRVAGIVLAIGWIAVIWNLSSLEGMDAPQSFLRSWLHNSAHAPFFGFLAFLLAIALPRVGDWPRVDRLGAPCVLLVVLAYALVDEWHQNHVPGRDSDWADVVTDFVGASVTLWIIAWLGRRDAERGGLWPRIAGGLALCLAGGFLAAWRGMG